MRMSHWVLQKWQRKKKIGMTEQQRLGNGRPKADLGNHTNVNPDSGLGRFQHLLYTNHYKQIVLIIDIYTFISAFVVHSLYVKNPSCTFSNARATTVNPVNPRPSTPASRLRIWRPRTRSKTGIHDFMMVTG